MILLSSIFYFCVARSIDDIMPLFGKPGFKAGRKVPKRRPDAGSTNAGQLNDKEALDPNLDFSSTPLRLSLGGQSLLFQNGAWVTSDGKYSRCRYSMPGNLTNRISLDKSGSEIPGPNLSIEISKLLLDWNDTVLIKVFSKICKGLQLLVV